MDTVGTVVYRRIGTDENPRNTEGAFIGLADGSLLYAWSRFDGGMEDCAAASIAAIRSRDGGETWTAAQPARFFPSPCSPMGVKRAPDGALYAVWNPVPYTLFGDAPALRQTRSPLAVAVSRDEGRSWSDPYILDAQEPGVPGVVEYPAVYCLPDALLVCCDMSVGDRWGMVIRRVAYTELA